ncbi:cytochrome P450 [Mycena capillaripes]|nr:cytochrome P450 [Mycena capillaripes]
MAGGILKLLSLLDQPSLLVIGLTIVLWLHFTRKKTSPPYPPGPRGLPFLGNVLNIPSANQWLSFAELGNVWGDISCLTVFGQPMIIIINSGKIAEELLEVRGAYFSDRPVIPMGGELSGFNNTLALSQYGDRVRRERKLFHQLFGTPTALKQFVPLVSTEMHKLLRNLAVNPGEFIQEIKRTTAGIALRIAYGYHLRDGPDLDPFLKMFEIAGDNFASSTTPAAFLVDITPALRYWPEWLPGGGFHTTAKMWSKQVHDSVDTGLQYVKTEMAAGTAETSFLSTLLEEKSHEEYLIKWAAASIEVGGSDTTAAQLEAFFLAISLYPDVQAAAQAELDKVVGSDRLPDISDRAELPYVNALCKEVLRWHVAAPTGVPHRVREDYIYDRGGGLQPLLIPKNSLIIPNIWKMAHDPEHYANPMAFNPGRFLAADGKEAEPDPAKFCFGYGRRICPGKLLADTIVFMACSSILSVFSISKVRENGTFIEPELGQTSGTVSHVLPFKCVVEPRNARALELIQGLTV